MNKFLLLLPLSGLLSCMTTTGPSTYAVEQDLIQQMPEIRLQKEIALNFGGGLLRLIKLVTLNDAMLDNLDNLNIAIYNVHRDNHIPDFDGISFASTLFEHNAALHWERIVRVRQDTEQVWVFAGMNQASNTLESISVFVMEDDTLTVISVEGEMHNMLEHALSPGRGRRSELRRAG
jgi:hypothetical protein